MRIGGGQRDPQAMEASADSGEGEASVARSVRDSGMAAEIESTVAETPASKAAHEQEPGPSPDPTPPEVSIVTSVRDALPARRRGALTRGTAIGRYVVLGRLGEGGMGEVYSAYDPELDRRIALKVLAPATRSTASSESLRAAQTRLLDEARALARLSHPNVVAVHDVGAIDDDVFIAMEFVEGVTVTRWLAQEPRTWRQVVEVIMAAGRGLEAAHAAGLVHRDVKPDNIILGADGRVRVIDFGIALTPDTVDFAGWSFAGTPAYMAPEQFTGHEIGPHTDQFGLAVTLYQALWRQRPFDGETSTTIAANVTGGRLLLPPTSDVPVEVRAAVLRALSRDPGERFPTLSAMLAAIVPPPRRPRWPYLVAGVAVLALAVAAVLSGRGARESEPPCQGFERDLAGVWDPARKRAVAAAFADHRDDWPVVERMIDGYASEWIERKTQACRATVVLRAQPEAVMARRMACLDTRLRELDALAAVLASGSAARTSRAESVAGLRPLRPCDNLAALGHGPPTSVSPVEVNAIEGGLAHLHALRLARRDKEARAAAEALISRARAAGWAAAAARALVHRGHAEWLDGAPAAARETLFEAIRTGAEADDDAVQAEAWVGLVGVEAAGLRQPTEALRWVKHAEVALARGGSDLETRGMLLHNTGGALRQLGRDADGLAKFIEARDLFAHALGPRHHLVAIELGAISKAYRKLGQLDRAITEGERAIELLSEVLGPRHASLGVPLNNLSLAYEDAGRIDDARAALERSLAVKEAELAPDNPSIGIGLMNLAHLERRAGRFEKADALWQRGYDLRVRALGDRHADIARIVLSRASDLAGRGARDADALELARDAVARLRGFADAPDLAHALALQCELERRSGALVVATRTCAAAEAALPASPDPTIAAYVSAYRARLAVARGELGKAHELIERGVAAAARAPSDVGLLTAHAMWARAFQARAEHRLDDARRFAAAARAEFVAEGPTHKYYIDDLDRELGTSASRAR
ncbi:MAG: serine/threonine-protein kinase [Kofleriaceae bacterium]|nr:serine/threonine-protein kinase [Kofleriaceae bacterium]